MLHLSWDAILSQGVANCYDTVTNEQSTADVAVRASVVGRVVHTDL